MVLCGVYIVLRLYGGGRPTSVVLLLLMIVAQLTLTLGCHAALSLDNLLGLVGSARGLVSLAGVKVLEVRLVGTASVAELGHGVRTGVGVTLTAI